jgi:hypothetical protein
VYPEPGTGAHAGHVAGPSTVGEHASGHERHVRAWNDRDDRGHEGKGDELRIEHLSQCHQSYAIHEHEHAPDFRAHVVVNAARTGDACPSDTEASASLNQFTLEHEEELRPHVAMCWEAPAGLNTHELHLPAVGRGDVFHKNSRGECGRPPG